MARAKKPDMPPPPPKQPRECKHGCTDCIHYRLDVKAFPCRDCERWNYWEDAHPEKNNVVSFFPPAAAPAPAQDPAPSVEEPKKRGRRTQLITSQQDEPQPKPEQTPAAPKKRGRKPKSDAPSVPSPEQASEPEIPQPTKKAPAPKNTSSDTPPLPSNEKEQLSLF